MACCNNECLEPTYTSCVAHTGELPCIAPASLDLDDILTAIDEKLCTLGESVGIPETVTIDTKCLGGTCPVIARFDLAYIKSYVGTPALSSVGIAFDFSDPSATFSIVSIQVFSGNTLITSTLDWINPIPIPTSYIDTTGVLYKITLLINGVQYTGSYYILSGLPSTTVQDIGLICETTNVVTLPLTALLQQIITEICLLKA
jgi:hypothetical protein